MVVRFLFNDRISRISLILNMLRLMIVFMQMSIEMTKVNRDEHFT